LAGVDGFWRVLKFIARSSKRLAVLIVGLAVTVAGFAMLALPGPGLIVIVIGLAILATEFAWAEYLLDKAKEQAAKAKDKAAEKIRRRRRSGTNGDSAEPWTSADSVADMADVDD
jgi:uncharacterized protein (TIGR02611 family)